MDNDKLQIKLAYTTSSEIAFSVYNKTDSLFKFDCEYFKLNDTDYEPDEMTTSPYIASKDTRNFILKAKIKILNVLLSQVFLVSGHQMVTLLII